MSLLDNMPKKRYNDEILRSRALELRGRGLSYREIAKELGCSIYKVHELLSPYESPQSRIKQVIELSKKVEELSRAVTEFEARFNELKSVLSEVRPSLELVKEFSEIKRRLSSLEEELRIVEGIARLKVEDEEIGCGWVDEIGVCEFNFSDSPRPGYMKVLERGVKGKEEIYYLLNVKKHPLACVACSFYTPKDELPPRKRKYSRTVVQEE
jgi:predicted transcriptional regulator